MARRVEAATRLQIRAYLLHRMNEDERDAFEIEFLRDESLLTAVKDIEARLLAGQSIQAANAGPTGRFWKAELLAGLVVGFLLGLSVPRIF